MLSKIKVAACVVLYHPDESVLPNISTYSNAVNFLIVVDNSEKDNSAIEAKIKQRWQNVVYVPQPKNLGIAAALNIACTIAIKNSCDWILTMDQDSSFKPGEASQMISDIYEAKGIFKNIGIISPFHMLHKDHRVKSKQKFEEKNIVMTSGNLLSLEAFSYCGPFDEKLFMDMVDYEYCLRLRKNNYTILSNNEVHLNHSLGDFKLHKLFNKNVAVSNHSSLRRYYMTRNSLYVGFRYRSFDKLFFINVFKNIFLLDPIIIFFYEKNKLAKLRSIIKGLVHFTCKKYGKAAA